MPQKVTAIFDIGKTNKKFFLFDNDYKEVYREYVQIEEIKDEDGFPTEDLEALIIWVKDLFHRILEVKKYTICALNFSTYGASFVHIDERGKVLTPLYNYLKPIDEDLISSFYEKYGPEIEFSKATGSPISGMLNSGIQLYWLKHTKPEVFREIRYSLHLPQYLSYIFTSSPLSEYTSIGCHTALWDYDKKDYHAWVYKENLHSILPPIVSTERSIDTNYRGRQIKIGIGIHDSSSALIPYIKGSKKSFILVSTGTWSVSMNPFSEKLLNVKDLQEGCINYMGINGIAVKSSKLLLGDEYKYQITKLSEHFGVPLDYHKSVKFDSETFHKISNDFEHRFKWRYLLDINRPDETRIINNSFEEAYHQLMIELVRLQVKSIETAKGEDGSIKRLFVDGGFSDNDVFMKLVSHYLRGMKLRSASSTLGSALGAAIIISDSKLNSDFLNKNYSLKKHVPFNPDYTIERRNED